MVSLRVDENVCLKLVCKQDAETLYNLVDDSRQHLQKWLPWVDRSTGVADSLAFIKQAETENEKGLGIHFGIWFLDQLCGIIGVNRIESEHRRADLGYWLGREYWGQGIITTSCEALLEYLFAVKGLNRVAIYCAVDNDRSRAVPERLGFIVEGVLRQVEWLGDRFCDHVVYGLLASEWQQGSGNE